jgi:hypothetical protein
VAGRAQKKDDRFIMDCDASIWLGKKSWAVAFVGAVVQHSGY